MLYLGLHIGVTGAHRAMPSVEERTAGIGGRDNLPVWNDLTCNNRVEATLSSVACLTGIVRDERRATERRENLPCWCACVMRML